MLIISEEGNLEKDKKAGNTPPTPAHQICFYGTPEFPLIYL